MKVRPIWDAYTVYVVPCSLATALCEHKSKAYFYTMQTIIVKNIEKTQLFTQLFTFIIISPPSPPKSMLKWCYIKEYVPVDHLPANETHIGCSMYFRNIDLGGKGDFFLKINFSQYILTMIVQSVP